MKPVIEFAAFIILIGAASLASCKKTEQPVLNKPPVVHAGADLSITLPTDSVKLDGNASFDIDGKIISYYWSKVAGPDTFTIVNTSTSNTVIKNLVHGNYQFELKVMDDAGLASADTIGVIVYEAIKGFKEIKARILEFGSDQPLAGATLRILAYLTPSSYKTTELNLTTDANGECKFDAYKIIPDSLAKANYWGLDFVNNPFPVVVFPPGPFYYNTNGIICDSFVIKLFPQTDITIHIKDSSKRTVYNYYNDNYVSFYANGIFNLSGHNQTVYTRNTILMYAGIDTTFQYHVFGNTDNVLEVDAFDENTENTTILYDQPAIFISKGSNTILNITY
jgi:hypothetical protein